MLFPWLLALLQAAAPAPLVVSAIEPSGEMCLIRARDDVGNFTAVVSWSPCDEVSIKVVSLADLREAGQLDDLPASTVARIAASSGGRVLSAWGESSATLYVRGSPYADEVVIAD